MTDTNASLNDLIAQRDALTDKIAELKKGRSEAIKKIVAVMGRFAISVDEIQLALPSAAPASSFDTAPAKAPYTGKKRGRKPKGTVGQMDTSGGSDTSNGAAGVAGAAVGGNPPASDLLQNAEAGAQATSGAPANNAGSSDAANDSQEPTAERDHSPTQRSDQPSDDEANPIPSAAPSAD